MTAKRPAQCKSNPVSGRSLHKTGIIPEVAGDFRRLALQNRRNGRRETKPNSRNAGISGLISHFFGSRAERRNAWLTSEDSNSHIPDWKKAFEMSGELPQISFNFEAGDFRLPPRPRSADQTSSPIHVSSKREYFRNQVATFANLRTMYEVVSVARLACR
jgi:hypothetical protein